MKDIRVCLMNDSFPPLIDGVANTVVNYATLINNSQNTATVLTPSHPHAKDKEFAFPVIRYPSINTTKLVGYRTGYPFSPDALSRLKELDINLIHSHCPLVSTVLARTLRSSIDAPLIFTYHTKFDIDIANAVKGKFLQDTAIKFIVQNISSCDDVWVVSRGAGENLRSIGYEGDYTVMPNGVDCPKGRVDDRLVAKLAAKHKLPPDMPIFLYVGRMMWYKNIRLTLDALKLLKTAGYDYRMIFVGDGLDCKEIKRYARDLGIAENCIFTGAIHDREALRTYYCLADAFLFPSSYDTSGLVVKEAAACGLGSVLLEGSCAAEEVTDCRNGYLVKENAESLFGAAKAICENRPLARQIGMTAMDEIYVSWETAVDKAMQRYATVIDLHKKGEFPVRKKPADEFFKLSGELMEGLSKAYTVGRAIARKSKKSKTE